MNWLLTTADKRQITKADWAASDRFTLNDFPSGSLPGHLFTLDKVLLNDFVNSQGLNAAVKGTLEIKSVMV